MADFRRDFRNAPVPIRLSCPFSNGIILNYYARAVSCNNRILKVLSVNPFDRELQLLVAAPFISGISRCHVASVTRSKRQASTFEIDLRFIDAPHLIASSNDTDASVSSTPAASQITSAEIASAASDLATILDESLEAPFTKAFTQARSHLKLLALIAALMDLTREKGMVNTNKLREAMKPTRPSPGRLSQSGARAVLTRRAG
jgi:hypothetical protein